MGQAGPIPAVSLPQLAECQDQVLARSETTLLPPGSAQTLLRQEHLLGEDCLVGILAVIYNYNAVSAHLMLTSKMNSFLVTEDESEPCQQS